MYDSTLGRWVEEDPAGYVNGANRYEDELDDPESRLDPMGLQTAGVWAGPPSPQGGSPGGNGTTILVTLKPAKPGSSGMTTNSWSLWDGLRYLPFFDTIYDSTVTAEGTSPGEYDGWGGSYSNFKQDCKSDSNAAIQACHDRINADLYRYWAKIGLPIIGDLLGDAGALILDSLAKEAEVIPGAVATGVGAAIIVDGVVDKIVLFHVAEQMRDAARQAAKLQCKCVCSS